MTLTTTHRHDYRWPNADCLVPKAEAPNGQCDAGGGQRGGQPAALWCGRDPPSTMASWSRPSQPIVCRDLVPTPVERPWCQRGLLVDDVARRNQLTPDTQMRQAQCNGSSARLEHGQTSKPWCNGTNGDRDNSELKHRSQPKGCEQLVKPNFSKGMYAQGVVVARVGEAPQQEPSLYNQPNQYINRLCDKYPRPMAVVTATPRDELKRRVYADRYRTTYQSDYCKNADDSARLVGKCDMHDPDVKLPSAWLAETASAACVCPCGCQSARGEPDSGGDAPRVRPIANRPKAVTDNFHFSCCTPKKKSGGSSQKEEEVGPPQKIPPWASEYTDGIGRMGQMILEQQLLQPKKKKDRY